MAIRPLYRLTVFAPYSEDATETTVLTPIAGAAHSDPFVVTTMQSITGAQPYLGLPTGRQGALDYVSKKTTTGNLTLSVFDPRVTPGGDNAVRWSTAFLGDALGRTRMKGCKFRLERALDGTAASLVPFMAGRIRNTGVTRAQWLDLDVKDFADDLNRPLFTGQPHTSVTYAALGPLLPNGLVKPFGNATLTPPLAATIGAAFATAPGTVVVNVTSPSDPAAMITQAVLDSNSSDALRLVELTVVSTGVTHYYQWPRGDAALGSALIGGGPTPHVGLTAFPIAVLPATDARTEALPAVGTAVTVSIVLDAPPTAATPILVNDVHPVQYVADLLDGKFSLAPGTTTLRPLATRNTAAGGSWATLIADTSFGTMREVVEQLAPKANDYLEKVILQRYNLALVRDGSGGLDVIDLRRSASLAGVRTLTDDDLAAGTEPAWDDSRDGAITAVEMEYWLDHVVPITDLVASGDTFPTQSPALIRSVKSSVLVANDLSTLKDVGEKVVTIAARGDRIATGDWGFAHFGRQRLDLVKATLVQAALDFLRPIGSGTITAKASYRLASANAQAIAVGQYYVVEHAKLPNPGSNERGGPRLMLCLSADERDGQLTVQWLDAGSDVVAVAPSISSVTSANAYSVDATLAANAAGDPILVHVAVTATSVGTHPAEDAAEWLFAAQTAAGTIHIANLPQGKRVWVRAQSYGNAPNTKLPSAWVYAAFLDLAAGSDVDLAPPEPTWTPIGGGETYNQCTAAITASDATTVTVTVTGTAPSGTPTVQLVAVTSPAALVSGAAIGSPVASGATWVFAKGAALAGDGGAQFRAVYAGNVSDDDFVTIPEAAPDTTVGQQILGNPAFANGLTGYGVYDLLGSGHVTHSLQTDTTTPNSSGNFLRVNVSSGTTPNVTVQPDFGGFYVAIGPDSGVFRKDTYHRGALITWRVRAKIPVGYTIIWTGNAFGTGGSTTPLTPTVGTGDWFDYQWRTTVGTSGSFSTIGHWYLTGTGTGPIQWDVAQVTANDAHQTPREAVRLQSRARVLSTNATTVVVRVAVADPFPSGLADGTISYQSVGTGGVSPASGGTVTPDSTLSEAAGTYIDYTITRPAFTAGTGRVTFTASRPGYTSDSDAVDIPAQEKTSFGPSLTTRVTYASTTASIAYTGSGGTVEVSIDGGSYSTAAASPIVVTRPAVGALPKAYDFRIVADGQTITAHAEVVPVGFGPSLSVSTTVGSSSASIAYTGAGTITLSIDGGSYSAAAASPIVVTRDGSTHTYDFLATLDGQSVPGSASVPALPTAGSAAAIENLNPHNLDYPGDGGGSFDLSWSTANMPSGVVYTLSYNITTGNTSGPASGTVTPIASGDTVLHPLGPSYPGGRMTVVAKLDGVVVATGVFNDGLFNP